MSHKRYFDEPAVFFGIIMLIIILLFIFIWVLEELKLSYFNPSEQEKKINEYPCLNLSLKETAHCLNKFVEKYYKYNPTPDKINLTMQELLTYGGDCLNYARFYQNELNNLGFENTEIKSIEIFSTDKHKLSHAFLIVFDMTGYCLLDLDNVFCFVYDKNWLMNMLKNGNNNN